MPKKKSDIIKPSDKTLFNELSQLIKQSQTRLQSAANSTVAFLFWQIGRRINQDILQNKRADYGNQNCVGTVYIIEK